MKPTPCKHPPKRLFAWTTKNGKICICCFDCGKILQGGTGYVDTPKLGAKRP